MKINSIPSSNMVESYKGKTVQPVEKTQQSYKSDRVELSDDAKSFAAVIQDVKDKLDTRTDAEQKRIDEVASQIQNGTYNVNKTDIAEKMLGGNFDITV